MASKLQAAEASVRATLQPLRPQPPRGSSSGGIGGGIRIGGGGSRARSTPPLVDAASAVSAPMHRSKSLRASPREGVAKLPNLSRR
eukprot:scaffold48361_cov62-Phaeocystis_antarctica.AAC.2